MMVTSPRIFENLAFLFSYPEPGILSHLQGAEELLRDRSDLLVRLAPFADFARSSQVEEMEECFTQTFDLNASNCLEVGWHLYGEDYKRGQFMVRMRSALAEHAIPESFELPDHLRHCLQLLSRLDEEDAQLFLAHYLAPAIVRIGRGLEATNPYKGPMDVLRQLVSEMSELEGVKESLLPEDSGVELPVLNGFC